MINFSSTPTHRKYAQLGVKVGILSMLCLLISACGMISTNDPSTKETQIALSIQQTVLARQAELVASQPTLAFNETLEIQEPPTEVIPVETQPEQPVETQPEQIDESAPTEQVQIEIAPTEGIAVTEPPQPEPTVDVDSMYENTNILLYEDVHHDPGVLRYYRETLDRMGLDYVDVGSAKGNLKTELVSGAPNGKPWDLVIIASENHGKSVPGEFFDYAMDALEDGSSVILEVWFIDKTYKSSSNALLAKCGVQFDKNWIRIPPQGMVLYPLDSAHPVLNEPNSGLKFTDTTSYWAGEYDVGDLMKLPPNSDADLLLGTKATDTNAFGLVTVCVDGRLTLQTFTSHNFTINEYAPLLENYIHNALKANYINK
jgi:hypothetical protein